MLRKVHWSVWGFVGFFSMMLLGLWVDSRWLLGVGVTLRPPPGSTTARITQVQAIVPAPHEEPAPHGEVEPDDADPLQAEWTIAPEGKQVTVGLSAPGMLGGLDIPRMPSPELLPAPRTAGVAAAIDEPLDTTGCTFMRLAIPVGPVEVSTPTIEEPATGDSDSPARSPAQRTLKRDGQPTHAAKEPAEVDDPSGSIDVLSEWQQKHSTVLRSPAFAPDAESKAEILRTGRDVWRQQQQAEREAALLDPPPPLRPPGDFASPPSRPEPAPSSSPEQVDALRAAAQQLDEIANHLERHNLYPRADQMRGMAQEMRMDARQGTPRLPLPGPTP